MCCSGSSVAVLSDAHISAPDAWFSEPIIQGAVVEELRARSVDTLVLLGDALDLNYGTLRHSVEGHGKPPRQHLGLRAFLEAACGVPSVRKIAYVPGNHDFSIWDWHGMWTHTLEPLSHGQRLQGTVCSKGCFPTTFPLASPTASPAAFIAGIVPSTWAGQFCLGFPHCVLTLGEQRVVLNHGHFFEAIQCGTMDFAAICNVFPADREDFLLDLFKCSAEYQTFARALAITRRTRGAVYWVVNLLDRIVNGRKDQSGKRGEDPSDRTLLMIEAYLAYVAKEPKAAAFVFGHTHVPGKWMTKSALQDEPCSVPVYNSGSFEPPRGFQNSSLLFLRGGGTDLEVDLVRISKRGATMCARLSAPGRPDGSVSP